MILELSSSLVKSDPNEPILQDVRNGQRFEINDEIMAMLRFFEKGATLDDVLNRLDLNEKDHVEVRAFLESLITKRILVEPSAPEPACSNLWMDEVMVCLPSPPFFNCPTRTISQLEDEDLVFLGTPFDQGTTGCPGARFGPDKLREASSKAFEYHADPFSGCHKGWHIAGYDDKTLAGLKVADLGNVLLQVGESFDSFYDRISAAVSSISAISAFPVTVGGDHGCTYAVIRALRERYPELGLIHIDAHTDLGPLVPGIPNHHGNFLSRVREEDLVDHVYQFGVRGCAGKPLLADDYDLFTLETMRQEAPEQVLNMIDSGRPYYLSLDIDVLDPTVAPGTGTPVPDGISPTMLTKWLTAIQKRVKLVGCDIMEVNPLLDEGERTVNLVLNIMVRMLHDARVTRFSKKDC